MVEEEIPISKEGVRQELELMKKERKVLDAKQEFEVLEIEQRIKNHEELLKSLK